MKRLFDVIASFLLIVITAPLWLAIAVAIALDSPGPVIFRQERIGRYGRPFTIYKFRTMYVGPRAAIDLVAVNDKRITRVGKFLRGMYLDELPQLVNVLRGEMSIVGPRPLQAPLYREVERLVPGCKYRLEVRPGLTGSAQVCGKLHLLADSFEKSTRRMLALDLLYVRKLRRAWFALDFEILFQTTSLVFGRKGI